MTWWPQGKFREEKNASKVCFCFFNNKKIGVGVGIDKATWLFTVLLRASTT
jgi:hypothetical protein